MADQIVCSVVGKLAEYTIDPILRQFKYMFCYKKRIQTLMDEVKDLEYKESDIRELVVEAERNAETIKTCVKDWQKKVDDLKKQADEVLEGATNSEMQCLFLRCPNLKIRYSLGRKATKMTAEVAKFQMEGTFQKVGELKPLVQTPNQNLDDFGAFETRISTKKKIMEALKDKDISIIGICGMAGVGKTTMANEIANDVKVEKLFDEIAIAVVSQDPDVIKIQDQLADMLDLKIKEINSKIVRAGRLRKRLVGDRSKSILVILDDVWEYIEFGTLGIPSAGEGKGLKILLTSRIEDVCSNMGAQRKFEVNVLSQEESWELFKDNAEISDDATDVIKGTAEKVARECGRLPLALVTVGRALRKKGEHSWKNALEELQNSRVNNIKGVHKLVYSRIVFSYNYLESEEAKSLLLLCSLFPEDATIAIDDLLRYAWGLELFRDITTLITARDKIHSIVDDLKSCYLLLSAGNDNERVKLHDVVRDVCLHIASKDKHTYMSKHIDLKDWPKNDNNESYTAISLTWNELNQLPSGLEYPHLNFLGLAGRQNLQLQNISTDFFANMKELRVLDFTLMTIQIPSSIQLLTNLRTLCLDFCTLNIEISAIGKLRKLEILSFFGSGLDHFPSDMAELSNLRSLDLRVKHGSSYCPLPPGILLQLKKLEQLYMGVYEIRDDELEKLGYIIEEIRSLTDLNTFQICTDDPQFLLRIIHALCIEKLERFHIIFNDMIKYDRENILSYFYFGRRLDICGNTVVSMLSEPAINSLMRSTDHLSLENKGMNDLDQVMDWKNMLDEDGFEYLNRNHSTAAFARLKRIHLDGLLRMKHLWKGVIKPPSFHNLMTLTIRNCPSVISLFSESVALHMVNLQSITISNCEMLEEIVSMDTEQNEVNQMLELPKLREINLNSLRNFKSFRYESNKIVGVLKPLFRQVTLPNLEQLCISELGCTLKILDELRQIRSHELRDLYVGHLDDVSILFDFEYTKDVEEISILRSLTVFHLPNLVHIARMFRKGISIFENLTRLLVSNCDNLRYLFSPSMANSLVALKDLSAMECKTIEEIIGRQEDHIEIVEEGMTSRIVFPKLSNLKLSYLKSFRLISSQNYELVFPSLEYLQIERCPLMTKLRSKQLNAPKLAKVWIDYGPSVDISNFLDSEDSIPIRKDEKIVDILQVLLRMQDFNHQQ